MKKNCSRCSGVMEIVVKDVIHKMFGVPIEVKNVPSYMCPTCSHEIYVYEQTVDHNVRDAYRMKLTSVQFQM